ncbi:MAG: hypothetical protein MK198_02690 [Gracilimonas sp.]|uniref:hypothetical protein n=1 Tax=Gracilimonas sp. TaxID=1974203 RepID=UPI00374FDCE1|nr:hypothetical protein [Gracilimonas sp.]
MQKLEPQRQTKEFKANRIVIQVLLVLMAVEWILLLLDQSWLSLFLVTLIIGTVFSPILFRKRMQVEIPAEFHLTAVIFIFASFYLGEVQDFYQRLWWWDIALHTTAGLLMGILGFLLVYILNENKRVELNMTPGFIAFFAFTFALAIGSIWEIFEFSMDQFFGMNMQKPMFGDPSGLTDTMWDIIVNALGASVISFSGYVYLKRKKSFFVKDWIRSFITKNPQMFNR